jgi:hypothetical protein
MMMEDFLGDHMELRHIDGDPIADFRMGLHDLPFFLGETPGLAENMIGNPHFADIMEHRQQDQAVFGFDVQGQQLGQFHDVIGQALGMGLGFSLIFIQRRQQGVNGGAPHAFAF